MVLGLEQRPPTAMATRDRDTVGTAQSPAYSRGTQLSAAFCPVPLLALFLDHEGLACTHLQCTDGCPVGLGLALLGPKLLMEPIGSFSREDTGLGR